MSTYKNLIGKDVNFLTTDPDNVQAEGQIWYNSPAGAFKNVAGASTWSSTGSLNTARRESGAAGTQTASVVFGGGLAPNGNPDTNATEEYNGFNFANSGNMNQAREGMGAAGTQTAALAFGGANYTSGGVLASNEEYGGSSWTAGNAMNNPRSYVAGFGLQTAAIAVLVVVQVQLSQNLMMELTGLIYPLLLMFQEYFLLTQVVEHKRQE